MILEINDISLKKVKKIINMSFVCVTKWKKLVCVSAYVSRFITNCKSNKEKWNVSQIWNSEEVIVKLILKEFFNEEYTLLHNNEEIKMED